MDWGVGHGPRDPLATPLCIGEEFSQASSELILQMHQGIIKIVQPQLCLMLFRFRSNYCKNNKTVFLPDSRMVRYQISYFLQVM